MNTVASEAPSLACSLRSIVEGKGGTAQLWSDWHCLIHASAGSAELITCA